MAPPPPRHDETPDPAAESLRTVVFAFVANLAIAIAKSIAAVITRSASMTAEATHSWADAGNEVFLVIAERRSATPPDRTHAFGYGRAAFVWAMIAAFGLFAVGSVVSISHGVSQLGAAEDDTEYLVGYVVLAVSFALEGASFLQALRQSRRASARHGVGTIAYVLRTSDTTVRSVFFEDAAALIGILIATGGMVLHETTGDPIYDAVGSILVGVLLGVSALYLMFRNAQFLIGEAASPAVRAVILNRLRDHADVERVTLLHLEYVGPSSLLVVGAVDLAGDDPEHLAAERLQRIQHDIGDLGNVARCVLSLSSPTDPDIDTTP